MLEPSPFRILRNLGRSREIATVLLNYGFADILQRMGLVRYLQWGRRVLLRKPPEQTPPLSRPKRIRLALQDLGPTFIKFGQVLSTRPDLIPADVIQELANLQERVPPFDSERAVAIVEAELGAPVDQIFLEFDRKPLAAGSLAQVHLATLRDRTKVAVKIRRPEAVHDIQRDLALLRELALLMALHLPETEIFDPVGLVAQFSRSITRELNFTREARTQDEFARIFKQDATLAVPKVYWDLSSDGVLTMEYVEGFHVQDREGLLNAGLSLPELAKNGALIFMKMSFETGIFHGDPHPGNIRILSDGTICLLDYGLIGHIEESKRDLLVDLFLAISQKRVDAIGDVVLKVGTPFQPVDVPLLHADLRDFLENYYGIPLDRVDVGRLLRDFVGILSNHSIRYPADLMLWIRAIITLDGVGRSLDPHFNLATHLAPFIEKIVRERYSTRRILKQSLKESQELLLSLKQMPIHIERTLDKLNKNELKVQLEHRNLDHLITELDRSGNRIVIGVVMSSLIVSSAIIIRAGGNSNWFTVPTFLLSSMLGIWLIYGVFRSGRL